MIDHLISYSVLGQTFYQILFYLNNFTFCLSTCFGIHLCSYSWAQMKKAMMWDEERTRSHHYASPRRLPESRGFVTSPASEAQRNQNCLTMAFVHMDPFRSAASRNTGFAFLISWVSLQEVTGFVVLPGAVLFFALFS